ncbi:MAG TPA: four helix bundle protein [Chthonomonadaceae bacterium]|nr:four helix bundle protein [Chthonomonadaceae bacterium]
MKDGAERSLRERTKAFALQIIRLYVTLPKTTEAQVLGRQVLRSGTSVGAHYREAQRAKSDADLISKLEGGLQELEETGYWLELLSDAGIVSYERLVSIRNETEQLTAILVTMVKRIKRA